MSGRKGVWRAVAGIVVANLMGGAVCGLLALAARFTTSDKAIGLVVGLTIGSILFLPFAMGIAAAFIWRPLELGRAKIAGLSLATTIAAYLGASLLLNEGWVCLVIAAPWFYLVFLAAALIGHGFLAQTRNRMNVFVIPLVIAAAFIDALVAGNRSGVVTDQLMINAAPEQVWKYVVAFPRITREPDYWLNRIGLPSAAETTCEGEFVGAKRACIFSDGLVFKEVVAELERERLLTFNVVEQPNDPELLGHITLHRGQFQLAANGDGTTTLTGRSWYTLHVRPLWYFNWWTRDITSKVHLRVMNHIKRLAEARK